MKKRLTRSGKVIIVEVYTVNKYDFLQKEIEVIVDSKHFNNFRGEVLMMEPEQRNYDAANKWADGVIELHKRNTE